LRPADARAQYLLALTCAQVGDQAGAKRVTESLAALDPAMARRLKRQIALQCRMRGRVNG
jgi:Flp pilus assembly protein TadD